VLNRIPARKDLVLVGGGHAHALVLRMLAMQPVAGLRITLISPAPFTPYSGMLPGLLAGHYRFEEAHIDLMRLCQVAGVRFLVDTVEALDPESRQLTCAQRGIVSYDYLSIDIGSQPELDSVPGAREYATPVKPVADLWSRWEALQDSDLGGGRIAVVGGGAGSVEVALAMAYRLQAQRPDITLYCGSDRLLEGYSGGARRAAETACARHGVSLECGRRAIEVSAKEVRFRDGEAAAFDTLIWSTGAAAAPWIAASGLPVDDRGFMLVDDTLQSTGYPEIFGAGDIATQHRHRRPKAGVYAVRQGPVLAHNLAAIACGERLSEHRPQRRFLSLLSLGDKRAVAERHGISAQGAWAWSWKDRIDREFMARFSELSLRDMPSGSPRRTAQASSSQSAEEAQAPCGGCGAKVGADSLREALATLRARYPEHVAAAQDLDDAVPLDFGVAMVQSVDVLRSLIDDPWRMGRIAAQHALSDLYATGAAPRSAQAIVTLPFAEDALLERDLRAVLAGAMTVFEQADCRLIGGHSMQGPELQLGFAVNGEVGPAGVLSTRGARAGDRLVLTSALGSGALFAAHMQGLADGRAIENAIQSMERGNAAAARIARQHGATALTDVTGFGLAGHLLPMLGEDLRVEIPLADLPVLPGALEALGAGVRSTMHEANHSAASEAVVLGDGALELEDLLYDPQTCGGLLMALPHGHAEVALGALKDAGLDAADLGSLEERASGDRDPARGCALIGLR
jgi:selenide,water dikinase